MNQRAIRSLFAVLIPAAAAFCVPAAPVRAEEAILDFHSDIAVQQDGSLEVRETIRVRAEGMQIRHGIYRDFPTRYRDRFGNAHRVEFRVREVRRNGLPETYRLEPRPNGIRIYAGSKDVRLHPAEYAYEIAYGTNRQLGFFRTHDELYWNVTGNAWSFPIHAASASVRLPGSVESGQWRLEGYTGPQGSKEQAVSGAVVSSERASLRAERPLGAREGFTIVAGWPKGVVTGPTPWQRIFWLLRDNRGLILGGLALLVALIYYVWAWLAVGRDPAKGVIIPRYMPPEGFSPALMRFIGRMGFDHRALAAAVIQLAVKGRVTIEETASLYKVTRRAEGSAPVSAEEQILLDKLFAGGRESVDLRNANHAVIGGAIDAVKRSLKQQSEKIYFNTNTGYAIGGLLLSMGVLAGGVQAEAQSIAVLIFLCVGVGLWASAGRIGLFTAVRFWVLIAAFGANFVRLMAGAEASWPFIGLVAAAIAVNAVFWRLLQAPTVAGRRMLDAIEGFRMYLTVAEKDRLNLLNPPQQTPELFERYLPYALALDVEQRWAEKFADVLAEAEKRGEYSGPRWYSGSRWDAARPGRFGTAMGGAFTGAIVSASVPPGSSSGGGGGGSSGGGGGGGGGGGW